MDGSCRAGVQQTRRGSELEEKGQLVDCLPGCAGESESASGSGMVSVGNALEMRIESDCGRGCGHDCSCRQKPLAE